MTKERAQYFSDKYKTFITVWQTSANVHEVRDILTEKGWTKDMENLHRVCKTPLDIQDVKSYANRLRKKGIELKDLYLAHEAGTYFTVNYDALKELADTVGNGEIKLQHHERECRCK